MQLIGIEIPRNSSHHVGPVVEKVKYRNKVFLCIKKILQTILYIIYLGYKEVRKFTTGSENRKTAIHYIMFMCIALT